MRYIIIILCLLTTTACSQKSSDADQLPDVVTKIGKIVEKEAVQVEEVEQGGFQVNPRISASIFSGGHISFGLGLLFTSEDPSDSTATTMRYAIKLRDGGELVIYSKSNQFLVEDCVEVVIYQDVEKNPPQIKRSEAGCGF